jgi:hypothetical protein
MKTTVLQTRLDRGCDRCGAPFVDVAYLPSGAELKFCQHHKNEHQDALNHMGAFWSFGYQQATAR